jgi:outer membrane protein TolC
LEAARYAYDRGATSLLDLLEAIRAYGDTRSDYFTAVHDYWVSVFSVERAAGVDLIAEAR